MVNRQKLENFKIVSRENWKKLTVNGQSYHPIETLNPSPPLPLTNSMLPRPHASISLKTELPRMWATFSEV